jgi:hypothetical protein
MTGYADDQARHLVASQSFFFKAAVSQTNAQQLRADMSSMFEHSKRVVSFDTKDAVTAAVIDTESSNVYSAQRIA